MRLFLVTVLCAPGVRRAPLNFCIYVRSCGTFCQFSGGYLLTGLRSYTEV